MISKAVAKYATENGYKFFINGLGYRKLVEITDLEGNHIGWTSNKSECARNSINALINQKRLSAKSNEEIAIEAEQAYEDLTPATPAICDVDVEAEQAYQVLPVVVLDHRHYYQCPSYLGIGIEVYCGRESIGYALAEPLDRPIDDVDYTLERQRMEQALDHDCDRVSSFAMSAMYSCGALL